MKKLNVCNVSLIYDLDIAQEKNTTNRLIFVFSLNKQNLCLIIIGKQNKNVIIISFAFVLLPLSILPDKLILRYGCICAPSQAS